MEVHVKPTPPTGLELYHRGEPLWTRKILKDVQAQIKEDVPILIMHCTNGRLVHQRNAAHKQSTYWHNKVVFFGYRQLIDPRFKHPVVPLEYCSYTIRQISFEDPIFPYYVSRYDVPELHRAFKIAIKDWLKHKTRRTLAAALLGLKISPTIDKVICFGLGNNLTKEFETWTQHPAALTIRNVLKLKLSHKPRLLAHDPEYTDDTKAVLESLEFEVMGINGVDGFVEVDENSVVFSTSSDIPVNQVLAELARPAVIITRAFKESDLDWVCDTNTPFLFDISAGIHDQFDPDTPRTKAMFADYNGTPLWEASGETTPKLWAPWSTTAMQIYVRKKDYKSKEAKKDNFDSWFELYD
ncbi:hypothetical protein F5B21DRAFT_522004 [Xylaria acuta]|nr:hypothetical protein F5B21DRAFT_522004 [Xylaria acuta]